jgi:CheY-like chemotaxis protein
MQAEKIGLIVDDMFFAAKINAAAAAAGRTTERIRTTEQLEALAAAPPQLMIIDLKAERLDPVQAIEYLKSQSELRAVPVVAFVSHVQTDMIRRARSAGCDLVLPHSAFTERLADIVAGRLDRMPPRPAED